MRETIRNILEIITKLILVVLSLLTSLLLLLCCLKLIKTS